MPIPRPRAGSPRDARMLAAADRLMREFEHVPVITVIRALGAFERSLMSFGEPVTPAAVESLARARLLISHTAPSSHTAPPVRKPAVVA